MKTPRVKPVFRVSDTEAICENRSNFDGAAAFTGLGNSSCFRVEGGSGWQRAPLSVRHFRLSAHLWSPYTRICLHRALTDFLFV